MSCKTTRCGFFREGRRWKYLPVVLLRLLSSLLPLLTRSSLPPLAAPVAVSLSAVPLLPHISLALGAACPAGSGAQRWRTAPDTDRTRSDGPPDRRHTVRSCTTTRARIRSRRCRKYLPVVLMPWWLLPALYPLPSPFPTPRSSPRRAQVFLAISVCVSLYC